MRTGDEVLVALCREIEAVANAEAAELVAEARVEAFAKVRSILVEAMTQALLERSQAQLASSLCAPSPADLHSDAFKGADAGDPGAVTRAAPPEVDAPGAVEARAFGGELGWYVYCVVGKSAVESAAWRPGVAHGDRVGLVVEGELAAVVRQVPLSEFEEHRLHENLNDAEWLERTARAHQRVLDEVSAETTVIPMRLCTIYRSEDSVRQMLVREFETLTEGLARLRGKTEWGLKMFVEPAVVGSAAKEVDAELAKLEAELADASSGAAYMRARQLDRLRIAATGRLVDECVEDVHARLSALAVEARLNPPQPQEAGGQGTPMVHNGAYLLEEHATDDFHDCVTELAGEYAGRGFVLEATGPWPPYNFVQASREAA